MPLRARRALTRVLGGSRSVLPCKASRDSDRSSSQAAGEAIDQGVQGWDRYVIPPRHPAMAVFDVIVVACALYNTIAMPLLVSFFAGRRQSSTALRSISYLTDAVFVADILLQFFHGFVKDGYPVLELRAVAQRYATTWFPVDVVSTLPVASIHVDDSTMQRAVLTRLPVLVKLLRTVRLRRVTSTWRGLSGGNVLRVLAVLITWIIVSHWIACVWFCIGWLSCLFNPSHDSWLTYYWPVMRTQCEGGGLSQPEELAQFVPTSTMCLP